MYSMEELIPIVADLTRKYTGNESTSIPYERANQLMSAIIYCMEENKNPGEGKEAAYGIEAAKDMRNAKKDYEKGYGLVLEKTIQAKAVFEHIIVDFNAYGNQAYYDTVVKGMPSFFHWYDPKFNPQDHILTLDYPTLRSNHDACGIDVIYQYLRDIESEQLFLNRLPEENIRELLICCHEDHESMLLNICRIVVRTMLGCMIAGKNVAALKLEFSDEEPLCEFAAGISREVLKNRLVYLIHTLVEKGNQSNTALCQYLELDMAGFSFEFQNAVTYNCLKSIFPYR